MWLFVYIHHVGNFTTNLAECWMHIRTKFDGGKQINRCQGSAWNARCAGATLRQNFGPNWGPKSWESIMTADANQVYISISEERCKLAEVDRKRKATDNAKQSRWESKRQNVDNSTKARRDYARDDGGTCDGHSIRYSSKHAGRPNGEVLPS